MIVMLSVFSLLIASCSKDDKSDTDPGTSSLSVRMTDAPANYNAVYIDLKGVEITGSAGNATLLNVNAGIYNLLTFSNGMDTLIATGNLMAGKVEQVRLILGDNNSVVVDSVSYPLSTPSAQQSGLKLQVHEEFLAGVAYQLLLDFDASQSIVQQGNGSYQLKPVIRVIDIAISGSIRGRVLPAGAQVTITANNGIQAYSTVADLNGYFLLRGVPAGSYTVAINPPAPFLVITLNNVSVTTGAVTDLGIINL